MGKKGNETPSLRHGEVEGIIVTSRSGWYEAAVGERIVTVRPRGRLRKDAPGVLTGDRVVISLGNGGTSTIERVHPRRNQLLRPPVANVDQVVIVFTLREPPWNQGLTDRIAVSSEAAGLRGIFVLNKIDLVAPEDVEASAHVYRQAGYPVILTDAKRRQGVERLRQFLYGCVTVFAGESGVGKSTLLNALQPGLRLETQTVSSRGGRGRHTTRHTRLLPLMHVEESSRQGEGKIAGYVVDTPGFSRLEVRHLDRRQLAGYFPEFREPAAQCRFEDCLHRSEPGCGVKRALEAHQIDSVRYQNYLAMLADIEAYEADQYR